MLPLFDMLANAQNGHGIEALARQFDLSRQQAQAALEALLPAFSQGLKRNASDPYGVAAFMNAMASGSHAKYFEDAARAFSPSGKAEGDDILGHIFGSPELSRAVAAQAAQATGISQEIFRQMLPGLAAMIMGGLFKQATGQFATAPAATGNPLADMMAQMMRQGAAMGQPQQQPANPFADNPFMRMFEEMMGTGRQEPETPTNPSGRPRNTYDDLFGQMFEIGHTVRNDYQKNMEQIFDRFGGGTEKR